MPSLISIGTLIDHSWELYHPNLRGFFRATRWLLVPAVLQIILQLLYPSQESLANETFTVSESVMSFVSIVNTWVVTPAVGLLVLIGLIRLSDRAVEKKSLETSTPFEELRELFWPLVLVSLLTIGVVLLPFVLVIPGFALQFTPLMNMPLGSLLVNILLLVGTITASILSIRASMVYVMAPYLLVLDGQHGREALKASHRLIAGRFWHVFFRLLLPKFVFILGVFIPFTLLRIGVETLALSSTGFEEAVRLRIGNVLVILLITAMAMLLNPILTLCDVLLLKSLKETK